MPQVKLCTTSNSKCAGYILPKSSDPKASSSSTPLLQSVSENSPYMSTHIETLRSNHDKYEGSHQLHVTPAVPTPNEETQMIKAIDVIIKSNIPSKVKLCNPNAFDGSNPHKVHTFLFQCKLNFCNCQDHFQDGSVKVSYVLSSLKGMALECFKPGHLVDDEPAWLSNFGLFIQELEVNFSTYDPIGEAGAELKALCMQENCQATKYFIKFTQLATHIQWGEAALLRQAYNGLAKRIKDDMVHREKLTTLANLRKLFKPSIPVIGSARLRNPEKQLLQDPWAPRTTTSLQTNPSPIRAKVLQSPSRRTLISPLALHRAKVALWSWRSLTLTTLWNLVKMESWPNRKGSTVLTKTFVSFVVPLAIWLRTAWNVLEPKHVPLNSQRNQPQHLRPWPQTWKKIKQSLRPCMTQGLHWTPSCENSHPQCIPSFKSWLSNNLVNIWLITEFGPYVPCGLQIIWLIHWLCIHFN